jgi:hypothetical protein
MDARKNNPEESTENEEVFDDERFNDPSYDSLVDICVREDCKLWRQKEFAKKSKRLLR